MLANDEAKTERFVEVVRDCILPQYCAWSDLYAQSRHLLDFPTSDFLNKPFAAAGIDWHTFLGGNLLSMGLDMFAFVPKAVDQRGLLGHAADDPELRSGGADDNLRDDGRCGRTEREGEDLRMPSHCIAIASVLGDALSRPRRT